MERFWYNMGLHWTLYDGCSYFCLFYVYGYTVWWLLWVIFATFPDGFKMAHTITNIHTTITIEIPWGIHSAHPLQEKFWKTEWT